MADRRWRRPFDDPIEVLGRKLVTLRAMQGPKRVPGLTSPRWSNRDRLMSILDFGNCSAATPVGFSKGRQSAEERRIAWLERTAPCIGRQQARITNAIERVEGFGRFSTGSIEVPDSRSIAIQPPAPAMERGRNSKEFS